MASGSPYSPPVPPSGGGHSTITHNMVEALRQTKPWVRFISVLMFIALAFMILGALAMLVVGLVGMGNRMGMGGGVPMALLSLVYVVGAILYAPPAVFLWKYASNIGSMAQNQAWGMEQALKSQKSFWKYVGILMAVMIVLYVVVFAVMIVVGIVSSAKRF